MCQYLESQVDLPESVTKRFDHSVSSFVISGNCTWVLITGGLRDRTNKAMHGPEITMIFELGMIICNNCLQICSTEFDILVLF